jgi:hypothetical protein
MKFAETVGLPTTSMSVAQLVMQLCWIDRHVPLLVSESGIGKTAVVRAATDLHDAEFVLFALAYCEPPDISGPQFPSADDTYVNLRDKRIPYQGYAGEDKRCVVLFDEPNRAEMTTLNAVFPAWAERRMGVHIFGPNVRVAAAMNPPDEEYAVTGQFTSDPAMRRRTCMVCIEHSPQETLAYAKAPGQTAHMLPWKDWDADEARMRKTRAWHPAAIEYLTGYPDHLLDRDSRDAGKVYACPATWEAVSDTLYTVDELRKDEALKGNVLFERAVLLKVAGHIGHTYAQEILDFYKKSVEIIDPIIVATALHKDADMRKKISRLVANGESAQLYALCNRIADGFDTMEATPQEMAKSIATFVSITPTQVAKTLMNQLNSTSKQVTGTTTRGLEFATALAAQPEFVKWRVQMLKEVKAATEAIKE